MANSNKIKVLLAEDDPNQNKEYKRQLERGGYEVTAVTNGDSLEKELLNNEYDIVVSDTDLEHRKGDKICAEAKTKGRLNNIFVLGMSDMHCNEEFWKEAGIPFRYKGGIVDDLDKTINYLYRLFRENPNHPWLF